MSKDSNKQLNNSEEVDLGQLFKMIGNMFDRFFRFLGRVLNHLFLAFVWLVFFIKNHLLLLLIAGVLGFGYGYLREHRAKPIYKSTAIIKQNYSTGENVYNTINYYNGLIAQQDYMTLAQELSIDTAYVTPITNFDVEALISENERLIEFNKYTDKLDSTLVSTIDYNDYLDNVKDYVYEMQQISISSKSNDVFDKVFEAMVESLNLNTYFKREREKDIKQLENRKLAIERALAESDSLKNVYKRVLESALEKQNSSQTTITIEGSEEKNKTKEFDLYKNDIELRRELVFIEREKEDKEFIIEILSNTPSRGFVDSSVKFLGSSISLKVFFAAFFVFVIFLILLLLRFIKFLERYKNNV